MFMILGRRGVRGLSGKRKGGLKVGDCVFDGMDG